MNKKYVIARMPGVHENCLAAVFFEEQTPVDFSLFPREALPFLGNIYVGKVDKILENLQAAFVRIGPGQNVYLPLEHLDRAVFKTRKKDFLLKAGDELLVQIEKEAVKSKLPRASAGLKIPGRYMVLLAGERELCFSKRLNPEEKQRLRELRIWKDRDCGVILRTNAKEASPRELEEELERLYGILCRVRSQGPARNCFTCLWQAPPAWFRELERIPGGELSEIVTDEPSVYETLRMHLEGSSFSEPPGLRLYEDRLLPLYKLYSLESLLDNLRRERVWLKSGGFLVVQQTEAFVSVDVNSGRYQGKKTPEESFQLINLEAAAELASQIRLRQLSGIILVDFINMKEEHNKKELMETLERLVEKDPVKTRVIDMTPLNILEMTREKGRKSLEEQLAVFAESGK